MRHRVARVCQRQRRLVSLSVGASGSRKPRFVESTRSLGRYASVDLKRNFCQLSLTKTGRHRTGRNIRTFRTGHVRRITSTPTAVEGVGPVFIGVCVFVLFTTEDISVIAAARITKLDIELFHHDFRIPLIFG